ncbi:chymotrypsinogen A-like isoform X2 [Lineus longissimus]|uniref:chymotrypsinogen A-like isoform X2 n=1 Tax=Lineus longissimus TaxID=88925 RepID=UPI002B4E8880
MVASDVLVLLCFALANSGRELCGQLYGGTCQNPANPCDQYVPENPTLCESQSEVCCLMSRYDVSPTYPPPVRPDGTFPGDKTPPTARPKPTEQEIELTTTTTTPTESNGGGDSGKDLGTKNFPGCGQPKNPAAQWRITYGMQASKGAWPWQVSLQTGGVGGHFCGGSILNENWILTAAHCVKYYIQSPTAISIRAGELHIYNDEETEQERRVTQIVIHHVYGYTDTSPNDIALLSLDKPLEFNEYVKPVCLPEIDESFADHPDCWVTGWGQTYGTGDRQQLQQVYGPVIPNKECSIGWTEALGSNLIKDEMVCFGRGHIGSCKGDSGGPLTCRKNNVFYQVGIVSFGWIYCNQPGLPSVFTRVTKYIDWINYVIDNYRV